MQCSPHRYEIIIEAAQSPLFFWRGIAGTVEIFWRERSKKCRAPSIVRIHAAYEHHEAEAHEPRKDNRKSSQPREQQRLQHQRPALGEATFVRLNAATFGVMPIMPKRW